jgi:hypothetical protein
MLPAITGIGEGDRDRAAATLTAGRGRPKALGPPVGDPSALELVAP